MEAVRRAGLGPLYERFIRLKSRLEQEGLFDPAAKRALPPHPRCIGVVTSLAAAALHDVLTTLARRNALKLSDEDFQRDADDLIQAIEKDSRLRKPPSSAAVDARTALRKNCFPPTL